jgi:signal transduction histidine kinase
VTGIVSRPPQPRARTRTAQEALVNTAKHAPRQPVEMHLDYAGTDTNLTVRNHLGSDPHSHHEAHLATANCRYGLAGMCERLLLLNGTLSAGPDGDDWVVVAKVPQ